MAILKSDNHNELEGAQFHTIANSEIVIEKKWPFAKTIWLALGASAILWAIILVALYFLMH